MEYDSSVASITALLIIAHFFGKGKGADLCKWYEHPIPKCKSFMPIRGLGNGSFIRAGKVVCSVQVLHRNKGI